jgi:uncharacterized protein YjiK
MINCSYGQLSIICETDPDLEEISAIEYDKSRKVFWVIQDSGNKNELISLDEDGRITHELELEDTKNKDWEDLTIDKKGNLYIGDFGNNDKSRNKYSIYKVDASDLDKKEIKPEEIEFKLGKGNDEADFEAFFLFKDHFYLFSKDEKETTVYKVPNKKGAHLAQKLYSFELEGTDSKVTSAAISPNGKILVLLSRDKIWKLTNYKGDDFFSGIIELKYFNHESQKEGIGFSRNKEVVISDERNDNDGGFIYRFNID